MPFLALCIYPCVPQCASTQTNNPSRSCSANSLVIALLFLSDEKNKRLLALWVAATRPVERWYGSMEVAIRDTTSASVWLQSQVGGSYMQHVWEVMLTMSDERLLDNLGLLDAPGRSSGEVEAFIVGHDEIANTLGLMCMTLVAARLRRGLYMMVGYPVCFARMLADDPFVSKGAIGKFQVDWTNFQKLCKCDHLLSTSQQVLDRSPFHLLAVRQLVMAFSTSEWTLTSAIRSMLERRFQGVLSTQVVEDVNNSEKNDPSHRGAAHFRRPQTSFAAAVAGRLLEQRHRFAPVRLDVPLPRKCVVVSKEVFEGNSDPSLDFSAANTGMPAADLELIRQAAATGRQRSLGLAWQVFFC